MMLAVHCTDNVTPAERSEPWYNLWGSLYGSLLRPAIPLFVMVTGALLLPVRENMQTFYRKRIPRVAVPFLLWSVLYNLFPCFPGSPVCWGSMPQSSTNSLSGPNLRKQQPTRSTTWQ